TDAGKEASLAACACTASVENMRTASLVIFPSHIFTRAPFSERFPRRRKDAFSQTEYVCQLLYKGSLRLINHTNGGYGSCLLWNLRTHLNYLLRRRANWTTRGSVVVLVMVPKAAAPKLPLGWEKAGVLVILQSSARNSGLVSR